MERFQKHSNKLHSLNLPVALIGDYNVMPRKWIPISRKKYLNHALFRSESRELFKELVDSGWIDAVRTLHPNQRIYSFWAYYVTLMTVTQVCGWTIFC